MGNFAENLNLGNRVRPPLLSIEQTEDKLKHALSFYACHDSKRESCDSRSIPLYI